MPISPGATVEKCFFLQRGLSRGFRDAGVFNGFLGLGGFRQSRSKLQKLETEKHRNDLHFVSRMMTAVHARDGIATNSTSLTKGGHIYEELRGARGAQRHEPERTKRVESLPLRQANQSCREKEVVARNL